MSGIAVPTRFVELSVHLDEFTPDELFGLGSITGSEGPADFSTADDGPEIVGYADAKPPDVATLLKVLRS